MFERGGHADLNSSSAVVMLGFSSGSLVQIEVCVVRSVPPQWSCRDASSDLLNPVIKKPSTSPFGVKFDITPSPPKRCRIKSINISFFNRRFNIS